MALHKCEGDIGYEMDVWVKGELQRRPVLCLQHEHWETSILGPRRLVSPASYEPVTYEGELLVKLVGSDIPTIVQGKSEPQRHASHCNLLHPATLDTDQDHCDCGA